MEDNNRLKNTVDDFATGMKKDAIVGGKNFLWSVVNYAWDILTNNVKKSISNYIYPDGSAPKNGYVIENKNYSDDYTSYSTYASYAKPYREIERDRIGNRSATKLQLVTAPTSDRAQWVLDEMNKKITNSSINACRVGDLYEMSVPKIAPSTMDWKYGWIDSDRGQFDRRQITTGPFAGQWMIIVPEPHLL